MCLPITDKTTTVLMVVSLYLNVIVRIFTQGFTLTKTLKSGLVWSVNMPVVKLYFQLQPIPREFRHSYPCHIHLSSLTTFTDLCECFFYFMQFLCVI